MGSARHHLLEARRAWLDEQLRVFQIKTYEELAALPKRSALAGPPHLPGMKFHVSRKTGPNGGVEVSVREHSRFLFIFEGSVGPSFEKLRDGTLVVEEESGEPED